MGKWEYMQFNDAIEDVTKYATKIKKEEYLNQGDYQIIDQGKDSIAGYVCSPDGLYEDVPVIVFGDHTRVFKYVESPLFIGADGVKLLKVKHNDLNVRFVYYYFKSCRVIDTGYNRHFKWLKEFEIPLPPILVQQQIADVLDRASALIEKRKAQIEKLDLLVKSQFVEMFGGVHMCKDHRYIPIKEFTKVVSGGTPDRKIDHYWTDGNILWVKTTELQNNELFDTDEKITQEGLDNSSAKLVPPNTVLIAMYGQGKTRGMTAFLKVEATTNQACACILPSNDVNQYYLWYYLIMSYNKLRDMAKGGNQPNLNGNIIKNFPVLMPPLSLQDQFAGFIQQVESQKSLLQQSLAKLEQNYKSLMQKCFRGEIF